MTSEASGATRSSSYCPVSAMRLDWATSGGFLICASSMEEVGLVSLSFFFKCHDSLPSFVGIYLVIIREWPPVSQRLLWFW